MIDLQRIGFTGKLDKDTAVEFLKEGDYTDALNVRPLTNNTESSKAVVNILGNEYAVSIGTTVPQNKIYSVAINSVATTLNNQLTFKDQNGNTIATTANFNIAINADVSVPFAATVLPAITAAFAAATPALQGTVTLSTAGNAFGEVIITLTGAGGVSITGRDYTIESTGADELVVSVVQEGYDTSIAGDMQVIGSYDLLGDLFVWSTSQTNLPSTISPTISSITNASPGVVTTSSAHGLVVGQLIKITGVTPSDYNGSYIVSGVPSTTTFNLGGTDFTAIAAGSGGAIEINTQGIGEIGVIQYDPNLSSSNWTYTRLIKSLEFNFVTKKQVDSYVEKNSSLISLYWVDEYNKPRVLYYHGNYIEDGALTYYNSEGDYAYGTIDDETRLQLSQLPTTLTFLGQDQSGGTLKSGNWRYAYRFVGESGASTEWSDLSNPVPVFLSATNSSTNAISGDDADVTTGKVNNFSVSGILPSLFKYIELAGVNYLSSNSQIGYIIRKELLGSLTSIDLAHTGSESYTTLDLGTLNVRPIIYETAKNITAIDNRLTLSNLTVRAQQDFSAWTESWTHSLFKSTITPIGTPTNITVLGEYNDPSNVYNYLGYMDNETYRFSAKFRMIDGSLTNNFWIDDILFDTSNTNITSPNRRVAGLPDYNLTDSATSEVYVTYIKFSNIDLDYTIDGVAVRDLVSEIIIERVECVKEILATGMAALTVYSTSTNPVASLSDKNIFYNDYTPATQVEYFGEYPFTESMRDDGTVLTYPNIGTAVRSMFAFYSPDVFYGNVSFNSFVAANDDVVLNHGQQAISYSNTFISTLSPPHYESTYAEYNGYRNTSAITSANVTQLENYIPGDQKAFPGTGNNYTKILKTYTTSPPTPPATLDSQWFYLGTPVIKLDADLLVTTTNADYGFYYVQYKRPIDAGVYSDPDTGSKYGNRTLNKYIPTGAELIIDADTASLAEIDVYGGDTFTQKTFIKKRFPAASSSYGFDGLGFGGGVGVYTQNRVNTQLNRKYDNTYGNWDYPNTATDSWLQIEADKIDIVHYNTGYNPVNNINSDVAFDSENDAATDYPVRIIYSDLKLQNGLVDGYRNFLPLNFLDLDLSSGEIVHMANGNGELITWQPRKFQRQYFNTSGILQTSSNLNVLIGDGSVLSRDGQTLSTIGSKHKWAIIKGKSPQGNDVFYWLNTELKKAIRFGYDGTISLADIRGMQSFLANNLTWVDGKDTPADGEGICGVWDDRFLEAMWSVRGKRTVAAWDSSTAYTTGQAVSYTPSIFSTYEQTGEIYIALRNNTNKVPQTQTLDWELVPHTNNQYYNEYNLVYNEMKNGFTSFYSFLPKIFLKWTDSFLTPQPIDEENRIYKHNAGEYCVWYDDGSDEQAVDGYIEGPLNKQSDNVKWFSALRANTEIVPYRMDFTTKTQESFLTQSEFRSREGTYDSSIKMDSTGLAANDAETSRLYGKWLKVKITFQARFYQSLIDVIVKFRNSVRYPNK